MSNWIDLFSGTSYHLGENWTRKVRNHLAELLNVRLSGVEDAKDAADRCAQFWQDYYGLVFPLKFGRSSQEGGLTGQELSLLTEKEFDLEQCCDQKLRKSFLESCNLPPLLTAETTFAGQPANLIADHHLACAALCNVILRSQNKGDTNLFQQIRLGVLVHELIGNVELATFPEATQVARFLKDGAGELPSEVNGDWLNSIHSGSAVDDVQLVGIGVQRIKQFVFESPGLNEIRGASTLLDDCVTRLKQQVHERLGPEVVSRAAAATLEFLAPVGNGETWLEQLRRSFFQHTGTAFVTAATHTIPSSRLLGNYSNVLNEFHAKLDRDRYQPELPLVEVLPFEVRCIFCGHRAAEGWGKNAEKQPIPICRVCITKRDIGRDARKGKSTDLLNWLDTGPETLGVNEDNFFAQNLTELAPDIANHKLAVIYGDGNNFGQVVSNLPSLAVSLQWTYRVEKVTQAAIALALAHATKEAADKRLLLKLPFQILSLGGDDLSVLTWSKIGLRVCEQFLRLTDLEFQPGNGPRLSNQSLTFSLGALFCDDKAPVRRTVNFTEKELLKWAKRATLHQTTAYGNLTFQLALTAEHIPADLNSYCDQMYRPSFSRELCLTMRPFTAGEIKFLLEKASKLKDTRQQGVLQNLVAAFMQSSYPAALLHYYYQKAREQRGAQELSEKSFFAQLEGRRKPGESSDWLQHFKGFPLVRIARKRTSDAMAQGHLLPLSERKPFGEEQDDTMGEITKLSPLWDLYEVIKILE